MIIDAFTFYNELELLEIRLNYLNPVVDKFLLVESTKTHSGQDKELIFRKNAGLFQSFLSKIVVVVVDNMPEVEGNYRWPLENHQRNCIQLGFNNLNLKDDDYILISDVDEIPRKEVVEKQYFGVYDQIAFMYYLNVVINQHWNGTMGMTYGRYRQDFGNCQAVRNRRDTTEPIRNAGWHFAWMGGADRVRTKLHSFAHSELDNQEADQVIEERLSNLNPIWDANCNMSAIPINETYPEYIQNNKDKFAHLIYG